MLPKRGKKVLLCFQIFPSVRPKNKLPIFRILPFPTHVPFLRGSRVSVDVDVHVDVPLVHLVLELHHEEGEDHGHTDGLRKKKKVLIHKSTCIVGRNDS